MAFARNAFGGDKEAGPDYESIASAVFTSPPMACVGLTQEKAQEEYGDIDVYSSSFRCWPAYSVAAAWAWELAHSGAWQARGVCGAPAGAGLRAAGTEAHRDAGRW